MAKRGSVKQFSFAGGVISPRLFGRTDLQRYRQSLQRCRNFIVEPSGVATNRPGTRLVAEVKDSTKQVRLVPFVALNGQAYALEFGEGYMRAHTLGAQVLFRADEAGTHDGGDNESALGDSTKNWVPDQWVGATVTNVTDGSSGTVTANTSNTVTATLSGGTDNDWDDGDAYTLSLASPGVFEIETPYQEGDLAAIDYAQQNDVLFLTHPNYAPRTLSRFLDDDWRLAQYTTAKNILPPNTLAFESKVVEDDATAHPEKEWDWVVTSVDANGQESVASDPLETTDAVVYPDRDHNVIQWAAPSAGNLPVSYNVYRGRNGVYGFIGSSEELRFVDDAVAPDFSDTPPVARDPSTQTITVAGSGEAKEAAFPAGDLDDVGETATATKAEAAESFDDFYLVRLQISLPWFTNITYIVEFSPTGGAPWTQVVENTVKNFSFPKETRVHDIGHNVSFDGMVAGSAVRITVTGVYHPITPAPDLTPDKVEWTATELMEQTIQSFPAAVAFHEQRLVFGNYTHNGQLLRFSRTGDFFNFEQSQPLKEDDSFDLVLASSRLDEIRQIVPMQALVLLTAGAEWTAAGVEGGPITPSSFDLKPKTAFGSATAPKAHAIGSAVIFAADRAKRLREFLPDPFGAQDRSRDLSVLAEHLLRGGTALEMQYADVPYQVLWVLRSDGVLLGMTYSQEHGVFAWHEHFTGGVLSTGAPRDEFESVCAVPEFDETSVYVAVKRTINGATVRFVERFAPRVFADDEDAVFLDCSLGFDGRNAGAAQLRLEAYSGTHAGPDDSATLEISPSPSFAPDEWVGDTISNDTDVSSGPVTANDADSVTATLAGGAGNDWDIGDVWTITPTWAADKKVLLASDTASTFAAGDVGSQFELRRTITSGLTVTEYSVRVTVTRYIDDQTVEVTPVTAVPSQLQAQYTSDWGQAFNTFSGLDHLEGEAIGVLVDGATHADVTVSSGAITLDSGVYAERLQAGIKYDCDLQTLPLDVAGDEGAVRMAKKAVPGVGIEVDEWKGLRVGISEATLKDVEQRQVADQYETVSPENKLIKVRPRSQYRRGVNIFIRQADPTQVTVQSVMLGVSVGGDV